MRFFESLGSDVRYALRTLWRSPLFTVVALLTLAIGTGATVAAFSVVNSVLLNPLPYPGADRLVAVSHDAPGAEGFFGGRVRTSASMYFTYAEENRTFDSIGVWTDATATVTGLEEPEQIPAPIVSDGLPQALAVAPADPHLGVLRQRDVQHGAQQRRSKRGLAAEQEHQRFVELRRHVTKTNPPPRANRRPYRWDLRGNRAADTDSMQRSGFIRAASHRARTL